VLDGWILTEWVFYEDHIQKHILEGFHSGRNYREKFGLFQAFCLASAMLKDRVLVI
jgi:hypothetical protein